MVPQSPPGILHLSYLSPCIIVAIFFLFFCSTFSVKSALSLFTEFPHIQASYIAFL